MVPLDFERDDVLTALAERGYRADYRTFFVWEAVTQYLTGDAVHATLESLRPAAPGSRLVFTYVRRDFIDGVNLYRRRSSCTAGFGNGNSCGVSGCSPRRLRRFWTDTVGGWRSKLGPELIVQRYVEPTGRNLTASQVEWSAYAEKA